ncbi:MAG: hypothetical protein RR348_02335 [Clostridia bacterium]
MLTTAPELTTGITDFILGIISLIFAIWIGLYNRNRKNKKVYFVDAMLVILAIASIYGGLLHGLEMSREIFSLGWIPLGIMLGSLPLIMLAILSIIWKENNVPTKRIVLYCSFFVLFSLVAISTIVAIQRAFHFVTFIVYSESIMVPSFFYCLFTAIKNKRKSAILFSIALFIMIWSSIIQQVLCDIRFTFLIFGVAFDFNSIYHIIMISAVTVATVGTWRYLKEEDEKLATTAPPKQ